MERKIEEKQGIVLKKSERVSTEKEIPIAWQKGSCHLAEGTLLSAGRQTNTEIISIQSYHTKSSVTQQISDEKAMETAGQCRHGKGSVR